METEAYGEAGIGEQQKRYPIPGQHPAEALPEDVESGSRRSGWLLLVCASVLLLGLAGAQGYVSWDAQYQFVFAAKQHHLPAVLEALGLDTGAVIFALLALAHARMARSAAIERALNLACALGSMTMNLLGANLGSPRSVAVYVLPAVLYAAGSDRLIATAGHAAGVPETSTWRWLSVVTLYAMRTVVALPSTARGLRLGVLAAAPLPEAPPRQRSAPAIAGQKQERATEASASPESAVLPGPARIELSVAQPALPAVPLPEAAALPEPPVAPSPPTALLPEAPPAGKRPAGSGGGKVRSLDAQRKQTAELVESAREAEAEAGRPLTTRELREVLGVSNTLTCKVWRVLRGKETGIPEAVAR